MALNQSPLTQALTTGPIAPVATTPGTTTPTIAKPVVVPTRAGPVRATQVIPATQAPPKAPPPPTGGVPANFFSTAQQHLQKLTDNLANAVDEDLPAPPVDQYLPPPPQTPQYNPLQAWGSAAMMIATLGSLLTRSSMTNAINSAADVMNAYKQNDADAASTALSTWKTQTANAINMQKFELEKYNDIMKEHADNTRAQSAALTGFMASIKDEVALQVYQTGGIKALQDLLYKRGKTTGNMATASVNAEELSLEQADWLQWQKANPNATAAQKDAAFKRIHSKSMGKAVNSMTDSQRMDNGWKLYNGTYPKDPISGKPAAGAPTYEQFMAPGGQYDQAMKSMFPDYQGPDSGGGGDDDSGGGGDSVNTTIQSMPLPPDLVGKPDGTVVHDDDGNYYKVDGDQLVPTDAPN